MLPLFHTDFKNWSLRLMESYRLSVFENTLLRKVFGSKWDEVRGEWKDCIVRSFILILFFDEDK